MKRKLPRTVEEFMAYACAMEVEATERYAELAELMDTHHNREVAELFAKLARIEGKHRDQRPGDDEQNLLNSRNWRPRSTGLRGLLRPTGRPARRLGALPHSAVGECMRTRTSVSAPSSSCICR